MPNLKRFTVTVRDSEIRDFIVWAKDEDEARKEFETRPEKEAKKDFINHLTDVEYGIIRVTES